MSNRVHLMCLTAFTALVAFSGLSRAGADDYSLSDPSFARPEESRPMTCAQATAFAWFRQQMELPDVESPVATPAECERTYIAEADRGAIEESR